MNVHADIVRTGATGYIGGTVLDILVRHHPEYNITVLLRKVPDGFHEKYPNVNVVIGSFDDADLISATAEKNNIVIHNGDSKHERSLKAHVAGLLKRHDRSFLIRLGGTGVISDWDGPHYGELNPKEWSDVDDINVITSLPDSAPHRKVERYLQEVAVEHGDKLKCAIISSCGVYGLGKGMGNTQSILIPTLYDEAVKLGRTFYPGSGGNQRSWVHIDDLMQVYLKLVEAAAAGGGNAVWGKEGYYFTATQQASQFDMAEAAGRILNAHRIINDPMPLALSIDQVKNMVGKSTWPYYGLYVFACNTRTRADRARKLFGYEPHAPNLWDTMEGDLLRAHQSKCSS